MYLYIFGKNECVNKSSKLSRISMDESSTFGENSGSINVKGEDLKEGLSSVSSLIQGSCVNTRFGTDP